MAREHLRIASLGLVLMHILLSDSDPLAASLVLKAKLRVLYAKSRVVKAKSKAVEEFDGG